MDDFSEDALVAFLEDNRAQTEAHTIVKKGESILTLLRN